MNLDASDKTPLKILQDAKQNIEASPGQFNKAIVILLNDQNVYHNQIYVAGLSIEQAISLLEISKFDYLMSTKGEHPE